MSLDASHIQRINELNESTKNITEKGVFLGLGTYLNVESNYIVIKFKKVGSKPHKLAWSNISSCLKSADISRSASGVRLQRIKLFRDIITNDKVGSVWQTPSVLRNSWNYSMVNAYDKSSDLKAKQLRYILQNESFDRAKAWCDRKKKSFDDEQLLAGLGFVCIVLESVMSNIADRLLID